MSKPAIASTALDLTVRFVGGPPIDEIVYWIRRCAERRGAQGPLTVVVEQHKAGKHQGLAYDVRVERPDRVLVSERDPNLMLAIRNAFDRLPPSAGAFVPAAHSGRQRERATR
jgi:hypothetical protein